MLARTSAYVCAREITNRGKIPSKVDQHHQQWGKEGVIWKIYTKKNEKQKKSFVSRDTLSVEGRQKREISRVRDGCEYA